MTVIEQPAAPDLEAEVRALREEVASLRSGNVRVTREELTYEYGSRRSFFQDLYRSTKNDQAARDRLVRHQREMNVELERRGHVVENRTNPNTTIGTGGEFSPPLWAVDKFATVARAGRVLGDLVTNLELPPDVSEIHIPKMTTGADSHSQIQGQSVQDIDEVTADAGAAGNIVTIAGDEDASQQLFDMVPAPGYDGIVYKDLSEAYNQDLEKQMLAGAGPTLGRLTGITKVAGIATADGTATSTVPTLWQQVGEMAAAVGNNRQLPPQVILVAPRRYYWVASSVDSSQRPLASPGQGPHPNDMPLAGGGAPVGPIVGIPCYLSGGILSGNATNADYVIVARVADMLLYESLPKFAVITNSLSGTLGVRLQLRRYVAFLNFKAASIGVVQNLPQPSSF